MLFFLSHLSRMLPLRKEWQNPALNTFGKKEGQRCNGCNESKVGVRDIFGTISTFSTIPLFFPLSLENTRQKFIAFSLQRSRNGMLPFISINQTKPNLQCTKEVGLQLPVQIGNADREQRRLQENRINQKHR